MFGHWKLLVRQVFQLSSGQHAMAYCSMCALNQQRLHFGSYLVNSLPSFQIPTRNFLVY